MNKPVQTKPLLFSLCLGLAILTGSLTANAQTQKLILVVGAAGQPEYGEQFESWADNWESSLKTADDIESNVNVVRIGRSSDESDRANGTDATDLETLQAEIESTPASTEELWIVLIGHGTDDRNVSKFNLRGPDLAAQTLNKWIEPLSCKIVVINCSSASGSFINKLKHGNRIVVTSTKSGAQHNFSRFGGYLSTAIADPSLDLDKDQQTSLLEAFLGASARTQEFYLQDARLATELAMIDDNGDGLATPADWFEGTRVARKPKQGVTDGLTANQFFLVRQGTERALSREQRLARDELESRLETLRARKSTMDESEYYRALEPILIELAKIYQSVDSDSAEN